MTGKIIIRSGHRRAGKTTAMEKHLMEYLRHFPNAIVARVSQGQCIVEKPVEGERIPNDPKEGK